jgi:hypothetical protein
MQLSTNLSLAEAIRSETAKRKGISNMPTPEHIENAKKLAANIFQPIREHFGKPIFISSGYRSAELNKAISGSLSSQHCSFEAIDIDMDGTDITNAQIFHYIKDNLNFDQMIWEFGTDTNPDWVHVSFAANRSQRKQILVAKKVNGKTTYTPYVK